MDILENELNTRITIDVPQLKEWISHYLDSVLRTHGDKVKPGHNLMWSVDYATAKNLASEPPIASDVTSLEDAIRIAREFADHDDVPHYAGDELARLLTAVSGSLAK